MLNSKIARYMKECEKCGSKSFSGQRCEMPEKVYGVNIPLPELFKKYTYYDAFVCDKCGYLELFLVGLKM